jgi:RNA recognition motif-containing protein
MTTVFAYNLSFKLTAPELGTAFEKYGCIKEARILTRGHGRARRSRGCGFIEFERADEAAAALRDDEQMILRDREVYVDVGHESVPETDTIFVANLGRHVTRERLMGFFGRYRPIDARIVCRKESDRRKGFGYVKVGSKALRDAAIANLNDVELDGEYVIVVAARRRFFDSDEIEERHPRRESRRLVRDERRGVSA